MPFVSPTARVRVHTRLGLADPFPPGALSARVRAVRWWSDGPCRPGATPSASRAVSSVVTRPRQDGTR